MKASMHNLVLVATVVDFTVFAVGSLVVFRKSSGSRLLTLVTVSVPIFAAIDFYMLMATIVEGLAAVTALLVAVLSTVLFAWAGYNARQYDFSRVFGTHSSRRFVRSGPYQYVRHPFYTSYLLFWSVFPIATGNMLSMFIFGAMLLVYNKAAVSEESHLASMYSGYQTYFTSTNRFFPYVF
jgi:protein-S-isoprenylcysteine O-methyltransferase Ste14